MNVCMYVDGGAYYSYYSGGSGGGGDYSGGYYYQRDVRRDTDRNAVNKEHPKPEYGGSYNYYYIDTGEKLTCMYVCMYVCMRIL